MAGVASNPKEIASILVLNHLCFLSLLFCSFFICIEFIVVTLVNKII